MKKQIITISREYGSGGHDIGRMAAERLGIPFYDKKIVEEASKETGIPMDMIKEREEEITNSFLYNLIIGTIYSNEMMHEPKERAMPITEQVYIAQRKLITDWAKKGPCVFVGRCADDILSDRDDVLRIFIYADEDFRVARASDEYGHDRVISEEVVKKIDKRRRIYYNTYTNKQWGDYKNYDMVLNSAAIGIEGCVNLICKAVQ